VEIRDKRIEWQKEIQKIEEFIFADFNISKDDFQLFIDDIDK